MKIFTFAHLVPAVNIYSQCQNETANIFIGANEDLKNVKCRGLDSLFFSETEIIIGDLSTDDEDVCRFKLIKQNSEPLRFEIEYNGKIEREVCEWEHYPISFD